MESRFWKGKGKMEGKQSEGDRGDILKWESMGWFRLSRQGRAEKQNGMNQ